jgi:adenylate kinase
MLEGLSAKLDAVVSIEVPEDEVVKRLSGRRTCKSCGALYHIMYNPPEKEQICDTCGGELFQRDDDNEATIRQRLSVYINQTAPLINYYSQHGILKSVPGTGEPAEIFEAICNALS